MIKPRRIGSIIQRISKDDMVKHEEMNNIRGVIMASPDFGRLVNPYST